MPPGTCKHRRRGPPHPREGSSQLQRQLQEPHVLCKPSQVQYFIIWKYDKGPASELFHAFGVLFGFFANGKIAFFGNLNTYY